MFDHKWTFNGTFGELWIDSEYVAEAEKAEAEVSLSYADIKKPRDRSVYKKLLEESGSGSLTLYKVNSAQIKSAARSKKNGKQMESQIIIKLDDPDALGFERVVLKNVNFENIPLTGFERATETKQDISFTFANWEPLDLIDEEMMIIEE